MTSSHAALIVDSDPQGLEALVYGFQGAEWRITACQQPETACVLVKASGAQIVVVAARAEYDKTKSLIAQLRANEAFRALPVLVLGPEELRASLKPQGSVDLLPLPTFVRDVLSASQLLWATRPTSTEPVGEGPAYEALITTASTLSLIRTLGGLLRSATLQLTRKERYGEIHVHEGELTFAQTGQLEGIAALQHLLLWNDGTMKVRLRAVARRGQLRQRATDLADELVRFQRDFEHAIKNIGPSGTIYIKNEDRLMRSSGEVPAEVTPVVRLCDGVRTLADIIDDSPFRVLDTARIVNRLVEVGILVCRQRKPPETGASDANGLEPFLDTARIEGPILAGHPDKSGDKADPSLAPAAPPLETKVPLVAPPVRAPEPEQRNQQKDRREGDRRKLSDTLQLGTRLGNLFRAKTAPPGAPPAPREPTKPEVPAKPNVAAQTEARAAGTIELRKAERRSQPTMRGFADRVSVVIDIPREEAAQASKSLSSPTPPAPARPVAHPPTANPVVIPVVSKPLEVTKIPGESVVSGPVASRPPESSGARVTGVLEVASVNKARRQSPTQGRVSIQLDASLHSPAPRNPAPVPPPTEAKPAAGPLRPPPVSPAQAAAIARSRIKTPIVSSSAQASPVSSPAAAAARSRTSSTMSIAGGGHSKNRPSGSFSAVESDFFEREADLYREEKAESFADLDDQHPKSAGKPGPAGRNDKNRRR